MNFRDSISLRPFPSATTESCETALQNVAEYDINPKISKEVKNFFRKKEINECMS